MLVRSCSDCGRDDWFVKDRWANYCYMRLVFRISGMVAGDVRFLVFAALSDLYGNIGYHQEAVWVLCEMMT